MATARPLVLLAAVLLSGSASGGSPRARLLQDGCGCAQCVQKGNTVADCESFGLDCGCYDTCPCATCVGTKGNTVADCETQLRPRLRLLRRRRRRVWRVRRPHTSSERRVLRRGE